MNFSPLKPSEFSVPVTDMPENVLFRCYCLVTHLTHLTHLCISYLNEALYIGHFNLTQKHLIRKVPLSTYM